MNKEKLKLKIMNNTKLAKEFAKNDLVISYGKLMNEIIDECDEDKIKENYIIFNLKKHLIEELDKLENYYAKDDINEAMVEELSKILRMIEKK